MANKQNKGILYYTVDTDMPDDEKIQLLCAEHGKIMGLGFITMLLSKLYREGYYYNWNARSRKLFAFVAGMTTEEVDSMIDTLLEVEFINNRLFEEFGIITSKGIQERYVEATRKRKDVPIIKEFWLIDFPSNHIAVKSEHSNSKAEDVGSKAEHSAPPPISSDEKSEARRNNESQSDVPDGESRKQGGISRQSIVKDSIVKDSTLKQNEKIKFSEYFLRFPKEYQKDEFKAKAEWDRKSLNDDEKQMAFDLIEIYIQRAKEATRRMEKIISPYHYLSYEKWNYLGQYTEDYRTKKKAEKELAERVTIGEYTLKNPNLTKTVMKYIKENLPKVSEMKYQMNEVGADKLLYDYGCDNVITKLCSMEVWPSIENRESVVNVCRQWLVKEHGVLVGGKDPIKLLEQEKAMSN